MGGGIAAMHYTGMAAMRMDGYLSKPISPKELDVVFDSYTSRKRKTSPVQPLALLAEAAIDTPDLLARVDGNVVFVAELVEILREDSRGLSALRAFIYEDDAPAMKRTTHGLKGALSNLSARLAASLATKLEELGAAGKLSGTEIFIIERELVCVHDHLNALCGEQVF